MPSLGPCKSGINERASTSGYGPLVFRFSKWYHMLASSQSLLTVIMSWKLWNQGFLSSPSWIPKPSPRPSRTLKWSSEKTINSLLQEDDCFVHDRWLELFSTLTPCKCSVTFTCSSSPTWVCITFVRSIRTLWRAPRGLETLMSLHCSEWPSNSETEYGSLNYALECYA